MIRHSHNNFFAFVVDELHLILHFQHRLLSIFLFIFHINYISNSRLDRFEIALVIIFAHVNKLNIFFIFASHKLEIVSYLFVSTLIIIVKKIWSRAIVDDKLINFIIEICDSLATNTISSAINSFVKINLIMRSISWDDAKRQHDVVLNYEIFLNENTLW